MIRVDRRSSAGHRRSSAFPALAPQRGINQSDPGQVERFYTLAAGIERKPRMEEEDFISKTQRKRIAAEQQDVGAALVRLPQDQLMRMGLPETLLEAILECKRLTTHEALRRQKQHIGKIMRNIDAAPIAAQ